MSENKPFLRITATGAAIGDYDTVIYSCTVHGRGKTSAKAKEAARPAIDGLTKLLAELKAEGVHIDGDALRVKPSFQTFQKREGDNYVHGGYEAVYSITVRSESVGAASDVYDRITALDIPTNLTYKVKNIEALQDAALEAARAALDAKLKKQCKVLRVIDPSKLDIVACEVQDDESQSAGPRYARAASAGLESAGGRPVRISADQATVTCTIVADYDVLPNEEYRLTRIKPSKSSVSASTNGGAA